MKKLLQLCVLSFALTVSIIAQTGSVNNTLGAGGFFRIKDGLNNYFQLDQATGNATFLRNIEMGLQDFSGSSIGVITKNGKRFLHNYSATYSFGSNVFLGVNAGNYTMSGSIGNYLISSYNVGIGDLSLFSLNAGYENTAVGYSSLYNNSSGQQNVAIGTSSLYANTFGAFLTALGYRSLYSNTTGNENTAIGFKSLYTNSTGQFNTAVGGETLYGNTIGGSNTAVGYLSGYTNTSGGANVSMGYQSFYLNTTGSDNTAIGTTSLRANTNGYSNTALGRNSMLANTSGAQNTALGHNSMQLNTTGSYNTALGYNSLGTNSTTSYNVAVGYNALANGTTGTQNTAIGSYAGSGVSTGSNLTLVGYSAGPSISNATNEITLGNNQVTTLRCNVQTITSLSDARDKKNIKDLSLGLNFLMKLKPREFNWDRREWYEDGISDGSKIQENPTAGFVAQELDTLETLEHSEWLNLVLKNNPEKLEATYGNLLPVIVKAIQELKKEKDDLQNKCERLYSYNQELAEKNESLSREIDSMKSSISEKINSQIKDILSKILKSENENDKLMLGN